MTNAYYRPQKPSNLRFQSSSSSPASPLVAPCVINHVPSRESTNAEKRTDTSDDAPPRPIPWIWFCHLCCFSYPLGATRRCLNDGHSVCIGETVTQNGQVQKHKACHTEFDFTGWAIWGRWTRRKHRMQPVSTTDKRNHNDCSTHCDFPNHCRHRGGSPVVIANDETEQEQEQNNACCENTLIKPIEEINNNPSSAPLRVPDNPSRLKNKKTATATATAPAIKTPPPQMLSPIVEEETPRDNHPASTTTLNINSNPLGPDGNPVLNFAAFIALCAPILPPPPQLSSISPQLTNDHHSTKAKEQKPPSTISPNPPRTFAATTAAAAVGGIKYPPVVKLNRNKYPLVGFDDNDDEDISSDDDDDGDILECLEQRRNRRGE